MECLIIQLYSVIFQESMLIKAEQQISKRIARSGELATIQRLCLDNLPINSITSNIKKLIESCTDLKYLTVNHCTLQSLQNFPHLPSLLCLQLQDNMLTDDDLAHLANVPQVNFLSLSNNIISSTKAISHLKVLKELEILQINGNAACDEDNYRQTIFKMLPTLKVLNCKDKLGNEPQESASEYISSIGSRVDLLEEWDEQRIFPILSNKESVQKTNDKYEDEIKVRKTSVDLGRITNPSFYHFLNQPHSEVFTDQPELKKEETFESIIDIPRKYIKRQ